MKTLIAKAIVCCALILPFTQAQAAGKNFYDLKPGTKFTLKVTNVVSTATGLDANPKTVKVPSGIPSLKKGQKVQFTIGSKGELKGPGFTTTFKSASPGTSIYVNKQTGATLPNHAEVRTSATTKKAVYTQLAFHKITGSGFGTKVYFVVYLLQ